MADFKMKKRVIQKEDAVFWMDNDGRWHNEHGRFEHPKLIRFFNASIQKDEDGYFVYQKTDEFEEKIYFRYEETAVFVSDFDVSDQIKLLLNTGKEILLDPGQLVQKNDSLYVAAPEGLIKFTQNTLVKLSRYMVEKGDSLWLALNDKTWEIKSF